MAAQIRQGQTRLDRNANFARMRRFAGSYALR
jgi:hypothetical protein